MPERIAGGVPDGPSPVAGAADPAGDAYERFKSELRTAFQNIRKGHHFPQARLGDLTTAESEVVMAVFHGVRRGVEVRPGTVARLIGSTPSALSQTLKALERKGYVVRRRLGTDSRGVGLGLTEAGLRLAGEGEAARDARFRELFAYLGEDDARTLLRVLGRVAGFFEGRPDGETDAGARGPENPGGAGETGETTGREER